MYLLEAKSNRWQLLGSFPSIQFHLGENLTSFTVQLEVSSSQELNTTVGFGCFLVKDLGCFPLESKFLPTLSLWIFLLLIKNFNLNSCAGETQGTKSKLVYHSNKVVRRAFQSKHLICEAIDYIIINYTQYHIFFDKLPWPWLFRMFINVHWLNILPLTFQFFTATQGKSSFSKISFIRSTQECTLLQYH